VGEPLKRNVRHFTIDESFSTEATTNLKSRCEKRESVSCISIIQLDAFCACKFGVYKIWATISARLNRELNCS
jgi:hypothetical protein